jgi:hypothetical protein
MNDHLNAMEVIIDSVIIDFNEKLNEGKPIMDFITLIFLSKANTPKDKLEALESYEKNTMGNIYFKSMEVLPPSKVDFFVHEVRLNSMMDTPTYVVTSEIIKKSHTESMDDLYTDFTSGKVSAMDDETKVVVRCESYFGTIKRLFKIEDNKLELDSELAADGKKFLPFLN